MTYTIHGSIRSKKNSKRIVSCGRFKRIIPSKAYLQWEKAAQGELYAIRERVYHDNPVHVMATFFYKGPRPDIHGCMESLADCIEGILIANDGLIESWDGTRIIHDKDNPRTEFSILRFP